MYDFRTLSPIDFEELVRDLLQADFGIRFESFGPGQDLGVDFRFALGKGATVVQAKHYVNSGSNALVAVAKKENIKVKALQPQRYIFVTSLSMSPDLKNRIKNAFSSITIADADIMGGEDLNNLLGRHKDIERKHFKLWLTSTPVLERILHSGLYNRTQAELDIIREMISKYVHNDSVPAAESILAKSGSVIISGEPGVGKTTLARALIWLHAEQGWTIFVVDELKEAFDVASEGDKRLIVFDDFLGQIGLTPDIIRSTDQRLPAFFDRVKRNKTLRFVMTTRDYILHQAQERWSRVADAEIKSKELVLNVGQYTRFSRAKILFNHIYFSDLSEPQISELLANDFFLEVIDHRNFNPRLVDELTKSDYVNLSNKPIRDTFIEVLRNPHILWDKPYRSHISAEGRALMQAVFFNRERVGVEALEAFFARVCSKTGVHFPGAETRKRFRQSLRELEGSVLSIQGRYVSFSNPGVRDFLNQAIETDDLFGFILGAICDYAELNQAWNFYSAKRTKPVVVSANEWAKAAERLVSVGAGSPVVQLRLLVVLYEGLELEGLLESIEKAIQSLIETKIDRSDSDQCEATLTLINESELPSGLRKRALSAVAEGMEEMMVSNAATFSLDELQSISSSLLYYANDEVLYARATRGALEAFTSDMYDTLSNVESTDELDELEKTLLAEMKTFGIDDRRAVEAIETRRDRLIEKESEYEERSSGGQRGTDQRPSISDDQVRSMFSDLMVPDKEG